MSFSDFQQHVFFNYSISGIQEISGVVLIKWANLNQSEFGLFYQPHQFPVHASTPSVIQCECEDTTA